MDGMESLVASTARMKLAIDLDGVLTEHPRPLAHAASAQFDMEMPESAFIDSAGLNVPVEVRDWVYGSTGPAAQLRPAEDGVDFLRRVIELLGVENVKILTARPATSAEMTVAWLRAHGFPACDILYADLKAATALKYGLWFAVEDSLRHARNYAAAGVTCFLVNAEETSQALDPSVIRVANLTELLRILAANPARRQTSEDSIVTSASSPSNGAGDPTERPIIVVSDAIHPIARARFAAAAELVDVDGTDTPALLRAVADADALVVRSETIVTPEVLAAAPKLRLVARAGVGVDNIDLPAATRSGVLVLNTPGANAVSAAEHTIALLLAVTRQIPTANESTHAGRWERKKMRPIDLRGRTVGIVGLGRVGSRVALRLRAFEMRVLAYDPYITPHRFTEFGAAPVDYQTLLGNSDVITFHVPANAETTHMLDAETLRLVKPDAIVINAARGEVVDQDALATAIREGRLAGAGVDVFPDEPCTSSPLFGLPNTVLTPHSGGSSAEALAAVGDMISTTTLAALRGEAVPNAVNLPASSLNAPELQRLTSVSGAAGRLVAVLRPDQPESYTLTVRGQVGQDVMEHVLGTALSESLVLWSDQRVTPVNAKLVADELGLEVRTQADDSDQDLVPTFSFAVRGAPEHHVTVRWDRADAGITEIDGFSLDHPLAGDVLITHHRDQPGMIGQIGMILGRYDVNIAGMQVGRHEVTRGGEAIMVLNVDSAIPDAAVDEIKAIAGIDTAYVVSLPEARYRPVQASLLAGFA